MTASPPRARTLARWILPPQPDPALVAALASELMLPDAVCRLLVQRGFGVSDTAKRYLRPRLDQLNDPCTMLDLDRAVQRLARAVREREMIMVHGDYDVDGMSATSLLVRAIRGFGGTVTPFIPRRLVDGYDLTMAGVRAAIDAGAKVLVTADCGTNAIEPVRALCEAGIDVIVSDHHLPSGPLPDCLAVLNPKRPGCDYPDKDLAAVGIAFKLALALAKELGQNDSPIYRMLDLVALATIADVAPLRGENRVLARYGLKVMAETTNVGLRALIRSAGLEGKALTAGRVGFILAPRLNAVGRLGHALRGVELLTSEDESQANGIARELEELNVRRQAIDRATLEEARKMVEQLDLDSTYGIVLAGEGWHPGVIGIVASRLVEEFGRPVVLVAVENGEGKGSGRSITPFDLHGALSDIRDLFIRFGGHRAAAGVTIAADKIPEFARRFNEIARAKLTADDLIPEVRVDMEIPLSQVGFDLEALFRHFEPFGPSNASPVLVTRGVRLAVPPRIVGNGHLKLRVVSNDGGDLELLGWGMAALGDELDVTTPFDIAYRLERDDFNGEPRVQGRLADLRR
ncbi:MAG: single-stranded-DNA-specific exonuclease RecJ [Gemmatimonadota bacterium]|nr:single-stranded-DNA-specific exonuclease RecJ [Gemmatimonadota bacterium]